MTLLTTLDLYLVFYLLWLNSHNLKNPNYRHNTNTSFYRNKSLLYPTCWMSLSYFEFQRDVCAHTHILSLSLSCTLFYNWPLKSTSYNLTRYMGTSKSFIFHPPFKSQRFKITVGWIGCGTLLENFYITIRITDCFRLSFLQSRIFDTDTKWKNILMSI